jgi:hypothetical protein
MFSMGVLAPPLTAGREKVQIKYRKLAGIFGVVLHSDLKRPEYRII